MAALPPPLDSRSKSGRAAGIVAVTLGALVAIAVAAVFLLMTGADQSGWQGARLPVTAFAPPYAVEAAPAASRSSRMPINRAGRDSHSHSDIVLMALAGIAIASLSIRSIRTQYRNPGCQHPRVRLLQVKARVAGPDKAEVHSIAVAGREDIGMSIDDSHSRPRGPVS